MWNGHREQTVGTTLFVAILIALFQVPSYSNSLQFDGQNDYVEIAPNSSLNIRNQITFEAWIKWEEELGVSEFQIILNRDFIAYEFAIGEGKGNGNFLWALGDVTTSAPDAYGGWRIAGPIARNEWVHVAMTYDGDRAKGYINGEKVADHNANGRIRNQSSNPVRIGMRDLNAHPSYFHGCIDEVRIWSVARTDEQIKSDMQYTLFGNEDGLVSYWSFDEGEGQVTEDKSLNSNFGVLGSGLLGDDSDPVWKSENAPVLEGIAPLPDPDVQIQPTNPGTLDDLFAVILNEDRIPDSSITINYDWFRDGSLIQSGNESSFAAEQTARGQKIECLVEISDGTRTSEPGSDFVVIENTPPSPPIYHIVPENPMPNDALAVVFDEPSLDPDGDPVVYVYEWFESQNGLSWVRRPEVSGTLPPPVYVPGEPEISGLYTQMGDYWRVDVTAWDGFASSKGSFQEKGSKGDPQISQNWVKVLASFDGDTSIGPEDILYVLGLWKKTKAELDQETSLKFFEASAPDSSMVGKEHLLQIGLDNWYYNSD